MKKNILLSITMLAATWLYGQNGILQEYVALGIANNQLLIREKLSTQLWKEKEKEARGKFMPDIFLDATYTIANGGRTIDIPAGDLVNPAYAGLNEVLGENRYPTDIANVSEQFLPHNFHETKIRLIQPILNSRVYYNYKAQGAQVSVQQAKQEAYENQLIKEIKVAYFNHLSSLEQMEILSNTKVLLEELLRVSQKLVANDKANRDRIYASQVEVNKIESSIANAKKQVNTSRIYFNFLLDRDLETPILVDTTAVNTIPVMNTLEVLNEEALSARKEITQLQYGIEANNILVKLNKGYMIPEINLVGDLGFQGFGYTFDNNQDFWFLQVGLTWPIFQGSQNKSKTQQSIIQGRQLTSELVEVRKQISLQVAQAYYELQEAVETLDLRQTEMANAKENFRISEKKYRQDLILLVSYNEARNNYTTAQLNESIARYNLKIKEAVLAAAVNSK